MKDAVVYRPENWSRSPLEDPNACLMGGRCAVCERTWYPRVEICPGCMATDAMRPLALSRTGSLYAFSVVHIGAPGFDTPYAVGYVDLPDGVRVFGHLDGWQDTASLALGTKVKIYGGVIGRAPNGHPLIGIRFAPTVGAKNPERKEQAHASAS